MMREAYNAERDHWYCLRGRDVAPYQGEPELWQKMAQFMLTNRISNYLAFISQQFQALGNGATCPSPTHVFGPATLARWKGDRERVPKARAAAKLDLHLLKATTGRALLEAKSFARVGHWAAEVVDDYVLLDTENELTPLFRVCLGAKLGKSDVVDDFFDRAVIEYLFSQEALDQEWGDLIPDEIRVAAERQTLNSFMDEET